MKPRSPPPSSWTTNYCLSPTRSRTGRSRLALPLPRRHRTRLPGAQGRHRHRAGLSPLARAHPRARADLLPGAGSVSRDASAFACQPQQPVTAPGVVHAAPTATAPRPHQPTPSDRHRSRHRRATRRVQGIESQRTCRRFHPVVTFSALQQRQINKLCR